MSKGQVAMYIVLGMLLLIIAGLMAYIFSVGNSAEKVNVSFDSSSIEFMIKNCVKTAGSEGINILGANGNYMTVPSSLQFRGTSYWVMEYTNLQPMLNSSADELQNWFNRKFLECVDYSDFVGYNIQAGNCSSAINYGAESVLFDVVYHVNITKGDKSKQLTHFQQAVNLKYRRVYELARDIVNAHYLADFDYANALKGVDKKGFNVSYEIIDKNNLVFAILDDKNVEAGNEFVFSFATNLERSKVQRRADVNAVQNFLPFVVYSPDKMAQLTLLPGTQVNNDEIGVWQDYPQNAVVSGAVNSVSYTAKGDSVSGSKSRTDIVYNLSYPVYSFEPNTTNFTVPAILSIYWDDDKLPNQGPVGMLYKGNLSGYEWMPMPAVVDYNTSSARALLEHFSEYTIVDCARQPCKSVSVSAKSEPKKKMMCNFERFERLFVINPAAAISGIEDPAVLQVYEWNDKLMARVARLPSALFFFLPYKWLAKIALWRERQSSKYSESETSVTFIPTCDQIIQVNCVGGPHLDKGLCRVNGVDIMPGSSASLTVTGGSVQTITALASQCEKGKNKCYSCSVTANAVYK